MMDGPMNKANKLPAGDPAVREVADLLRDLLHALLRASFPAWMDLPLTLPQLRVVFTVAHNQTSSVRQIARQLEIGEPTASYLIEKLVQAGLLRRSEDPADRRRVRVELTPAGEGLIDRLLGWETLLGGWLRRTPARDLAVLQRGLAAVMREVHHE